MNVPCKRVHLLNRDPDNFSPCKRGRPICIDITKRWMCDLGQIPWREWSSWSFCKRDSRHCTRQRTCPRGAGGRCFGQSSQVAACAAGICQGKGRQSTQSVRSHFGAKAAKAYGNSGLNYGAAAGSKSE